MAKDSFNKSLIELQKNLQDKDIHTIHATAHKLKGMALSSSCPILAKLSTELESQSEFIPEIIDRLVNQIIKEIGIIQELL